MTKEARMTKPEKARPDSNCRGGYFLGWLGHSLVMRHWSFVI